MRMQNNHAFQLLWSPSLWKIPFLQSDEPSWSWHHCKLKDSPTEHWNSKVRTCLGKENVSCCNSIKIFQQMHWLKNFTLKGDPLFSWLKEACNGTSKPSSSSSSVLVQSRSFSQLLSSFASYTAFFVTKDQKSKNKLKQNNSFCQRYDYMNNTAS